MEELTIEKYLEKYPYLKEMTEYTLFVTKEELEQIRNSEKINIDKDTVSIEYIKKILNNDFYFEYASRYFNGDINQFMVTNIINGDIGPAVRYKKSTIINAIEQLIISGKVILQPYEEKRLAILKESISFEKFQEKYKGNTYNIDIEGQNFSISIDNLLSFIQLPEEQFNNICTNESIKEINGIPKEYFIYALKNFLSINKSLEEYLLPNNVVKRYIDITSSQIIDLQSINKHLTTSDTKYQNIEIDNNLKREIISKIPENVSSLEKAIYIYIKMCKLLTYDEEYYAVNQKGEATKKHVNPNYVSSITLENNKVVCFEFNLIFAKLLNELGINFSSEYKGMVGEAYGSGHANLEFRAGKYLIKADSVTSILNGDIVHAKLNQMLVGLICLNINQQTQQEFKIALNKMYQLIAQQENSLNKTVKQEETLEELLEEYSSITVNNQTISLNERLSILAAKVNSTKMVGIDSLSYLLQLRKILFTEEQRKNNMDITIIRNNEPIEEDRVAMASAIFTLNGISYDENPEENIYYYFNPNHELIPITKQKLQAKFDNGSMEYIDKKDKKIPGIVEEVELKR